ncbi:recombinase family protein [Frigoribacterium sp. 9N]|uniref:recombinase family protein n=1 Tax=Frigoribacterium sp. 9N TaxID=2653144 RepID=UPI00351B2AB8
MLGVEDRYVYVDHDPVGASKDRPCFREASAEARYADYLVVVKLDGLARSLHESLVLSCSESVYTIIEAKFLP